MVELTRFSACCLTSKPSSGGCAAALLYARRQAQNEKTGGAEGIRTLHFLLAKQALYQLSYSPMPDYLLYPTPCPNPEPAEGELQPHDSPQLCLTPCFPPCALFRNSRNYTTPHAAFQQKPARRPPKADASCKRWGKLRSCSWPKPGRTPRDRGRSSGSPGRTACRRSAWRRCRACRT